MEIGFIGLGQMGSGLACNLIKKGKDVLLYDINESAIDKILEQGIGGKKATELKELKDVDILFTSLPLPKHIFETMLGENGLLDLMKKNAVYIEVSTIDPESARRLFDECEKRDIKYLQCPLGLTPAQAREGTEPIYVGGKRNVYEEMKEILSLVGGEITYLGQVEASAAFKIISNLIGMTNLSVLCEGLRIGEKAGIDRELLLSLLLDTGASSFQMKVRGPWILNEDFSNRFGLNLALKDIRLGVKMADNWKNDAKTMGVALNYFEKASSKELGENDCCAIYKVIE